MKDLGRLHYCLGIEFSQDEGNLKMSQAKYIDDLLRKFNMKGAKTVTTAMDPNQKFTTEMCPKNDAERSEMEDIPYQSLIGSLMYLSVATRPDITHSVNFLSIFNNNPGKLHWQTAKRILRYLKLTRDQGIEFKKTGEPLTAFADANLASCTSDRRSFTGIVCKHAGSAITWEARKQRTVALSTTEA
ncbi:hypothetical protein JTE90_020498 [Oedothorax gibbosus]|uniref:Reverse transcriptase Ty1/copia-type domain-containing protein n=1 Tax=Oedothorax gibbosus TaxID=931172 RepID=A0AAV6URD7_9ARAC|nr:hypothetical protein JTE90_020498 [Oedothorax gibbosus]